MREQHSKIGGYQGGVDSRSKDPLGGSKRALWSDQEHVCAITILLSLATVLLLLPGINKAYHIDDPLFIWAAKHIQREPLDPYGFNVNWYGISEPMAMIMKNPPGTSYFIALGGSVLGYGEPGIHSLFLIPAIVVVLATYSLARRLCKHSTLAAFLTLAAPGFLVSASTVMSDVLMLAFWMLAVVAWIRGVEKQSHCWYAVASILIPLGVFTKYYAMSLIPLLFFYTWWKLGKPGLWLLHFVTPVVALVAYQLLTGLLYGHGLLADAASYPAALPKTASGWSISKLLIGLAFAGGCIGSVIFFARNLFGVSATVLGFAIALVICGGVYKASAIGAYPLPAEGGTRAWIGLQFGLMIVGGFALGMLVVQNFMRERSAESFLLGLWVVGALVFAIFVNWTINARSLLPMTPAAAILIIRRMEDREKTRPGLFSFGSTVFPLAATALLSLMVLWGDISHAGAARSAARIIHDKYGSNELYFQGHWGFQYYFQNYGARAIEVDKTEVDANSVIVMPMLNSNIDPLPEEWTVLQETLQIPIKAPVATTSIACGAGFYTEAFGCLPYSFLPAKRDSYAILRIRPTLIQ